MCNTKPKKVFWQKVAKIIGKKCAHNL